MASRHLKLLLTSVLTVLVGCRAAQLQNDQDAFRARLQQMHTDQIMENLILGYEGLPFVQLDYSKITGTVTHVAELTGSDTQTFGTGRNFGPTMLLATATRSLSTVYGLAIRGNQQKQLTVTADPVVNQPSVYRAYLEFLAKDGCLQVSDCPPPEGVALICRQRCNRWYWVPIEFRNDFRTLSVRVVAMRGEAIDGPQEFDAKILGISKQKKGNVETNNGVVESEQWELSLKLSPSLPKDQGKVKLVIDGYIYTFDFEAPDEGGEVTKSDSGVKEAKMDEIRIIYVFDRRRYDLVTDDDRKNGHIPLQPKEIAKQLANVDIKLKLNRHVPAISTTNDLLKSIEHELQLQRMDRLRN